MTGRGGMTRRGPVHDGSRRLEHVEHGFGPVWDADSRVLVLGSMPSPKSRAMRFYYGHPLNRFWPCMAAVFDDGACLTARQRDLMARAGVPAPPDWDGAGIDADDDGVGMADPDDGAASLDALAEARRRFALRHHVALWDVLASCDIAGASDTSIRNAVPNDLASVIIPSRITRVFATGAKAAQLYRRLCLPALEMAGLHGLEAVQLPSTSPANAATRLPALVDAYRAIADAAAAEPQ